MASDLDTVRVLRALFNDMPRAPQGLSHEETMAWVQAVTTPTHIQVFSTPT